MELPLSGPVFRSIKWILFHGVLAWIVRNGALKMSKCWANMIIFWDIAQGGRELDLLLIFGDEVMLSPVLKFKRYENTKSPHPCLFTTQQSSLIWPMLPASWALDEFRRSKRKWSLLARTSVEAIEACFGVRLKGMCREGNEEGISGQEMCNKHLGIKKPGI